MSLRVAVQMDPLDRINVAGDSTFAIMLKAQELGLALSYFPPGARTYAGGGLGSWAPRAHGKRAPGDLYRLGAPQTPAPGRDVVVPPTPRPPPFDLGYITAT